MERAKRLALWLSLAGLGLLASHSSLWGHERLELLRPAIRRAVPSQPSDAQLDASSQQTVKGIVRGRKEPYYRILLIHDGLNTYASEPGYTLDTSQDFTFGTQLSQLLGHRYDIIDLGKSMSVARSWQQTAVYFTEKLWDTHVEPSLERTTGIIVDLVIVSLGRAEPFETGGSPPWTFAERIVEISLELQAAAVRKVLVLGPYPFGDPPDDWIPSWHMQQQHIYLGQQEKNGNFPIGSHVLPIYQHFNPLLHSDETFLGWVHLVHRMWPNQAGHRLIAHILARHIRQLVHKKPMHWPGHPVFEEGLNKSIEYPPNWYIDE